MELLERKKKDLNILYNILSYKGIKMDDKEFILQNWQHVSTDTQELLAALGVTPKEEVLENGTERNKEVCL